MVLEVQCLSDLPNMKPPARQTEGAAGYDIFTPVAFKIPPRSKFLVCTGYAFAIPENVCGLLWSRSGHALRKDVETGAGLIDSDYRGEIMVLLRNLSETQTAYFEAGDAVAQLLLLPVITTSVKVVEKLSETKRGEGGFGSTDTKKPASRDASPVRPPLQPAPNPE